MTPQERHKLFLSRLDYLQELYDELCFTCTSDVHELVKEEFPQDDFTFSEIENWLFPPERVDSELNYKHVI